jgi:hypothetical protein
MAFVQTGNISLLKCFIQKWKGHKDVVKDFHKTPEALKCSEELILREVLSEAYSEEIDCIRNDSPLPRISSILAS